MAGVVFYYEDSGVDVWSGNVHHLDAWNYAMKLCSDVTDAVIINMTSQHITFNREFNVQIVSEMPDLQGTLAQVVCPWEFNASAISLWGFDHEVDWYVFGPASGWSGSDLSTTKVTIPSASPIGLHAMHAATVVLAHRYGVKG